MNKNSIQVAKEKGFADLAMTLINFSPSSAKEFKSFSLIINFDKCSRSFRIIIKFNSFKKSKGWILKETKNELLFSDKLIWKYALKGSSNP